MRDFAPAAIILSGGPASTHEALSPRAPQAVFEAAVPVLGVCYGEQTMCAQLGGRVEPSTEREYGRAEIRLDQPSPLFEGLLAPGQRSTVWMSHGDRITAIPPGFAVIAQSDTSPFATIADESRRYYGVQFHPEVVHTAIGSGLLQNFLFRIAGLAGDWSMHAYRAQAIAKVQAQVGSAGVICGLSGGVDSAVTALLLHEAIGDQLTCVFVDTGLLRFGEAKEVVDLFRGHFNIPLIHSDAGPLFLERLAGLSDPELKRKAIGATFIDVFDAEAKQLTDIRFLAQGTLYPDVIESVSFAGPSVTIKSHHNVGGLPARMKLGLVEPLRELFKDEVRELGRELGLPEPFVRRHPFPGPGLAVRMPGADHRRPRRHPAAGRPHLPGGDPRRRPLRRHLAGLRRPAPGQDRGRHGRPAHLRGRLRAARRHLRRRHDRRLLPLRARLPRPRRHPHRQRGQGHQPRGLRLHQQAAGHDRVGVGVNAPRTGRAPSRRRA